MYIFLPDAFKYYSPDKKHMRYPRIRDTPVQTDQAGRPLCRKCQGPVPPNRRAYCSESCMTAYNRENSWYWVRKDVLRRDSYRCCICKKRFRKRELDIDHIIPVQMGGELFSKDNLRTLCRDCHAAKTSLDREALKPAELDRKPCQADDV